MSVTDRMFALFRKAPQLRTPADLADFLDEQAAFLVQKVIYESTRYTARDWNGLFKEEAFKEAVDRARWGNYPIGLGHVAEMVLSVFQRARLGAPFAIAEGLQLCVGEVTSRYPVPHGFDARFWPEVHADVAARLRRAAARPPRPVMDMVQERGQEFFDRFPIHERLRGRDPEYVVNNLRGNLLQAHETFLKRADLPALAAALAREPGVAARSGEH